jgi:hypothetical protein
VGLSAVTKFTFHNFFSFFFLLSRCSYPITGFDRSKAAVVRQRSTETETGVEHEPRFVLFEFAGSVTGTTSCGGIIDTFDGDGGR